MKAFGRIPISLLVLLLCTVRISAAVGGKATHRHPSSIGGDDDEVTITEADVEARRVHEPHDMMEYGRAMVEAVVIGRPSVDFSSILQNGDNAVEILTALCHPSRLIRSIFLSWVATEAWSKSGLFRRGFRLPKQQQTGKRYKRVTTTRKTYTRKVKGLIEEPMDEEQFNQQYASSHREQRVQAGKAKDTFGGLVPESQEKGDFLTKTNREKILNKFEVKSPERRYKPRAAKKRFTFLRLTRKKKFSVIWAVGYILSPFLLTPIGGAIAGWAGICCIGAELVPWVDKKLKLNSLDDNELLEWLVDTLRDSDFLKAILFGLIVGGISL